MARIQLAFETACGQAAKVPYVLMRHDLWHVTYSEVFSDLESAWQRYEDPSFHLGWSKAMMIVNSDFVNQRHYDHVPGLSHLALFWVPRASKTP